MPLPSCMWRRSSSDSGRSGRKVGGEVEARGREGVGVDGPRAGTAGRVIAEGGNEREPRKQPLGDPPVVRIGLAVAAAVQRQAERCALDLEDHVAVGLDILV